MVDAARGDERPELLEGIAEAAAAAGVDPERWPVRCSASGESSRSHKSCSQELADRPDGKEDVILDATTRTVVSENERSYPTADLTFKRQERPAPEVAAPRFLTCGIWFDPLHYMRVSVPPGDIVPFLGSGSSTLAGTFFWAILEHQGGSTAATGCPRVHADPDSVLQAMVRHTRATRDMSASLVKRLAAARLEYRKTGSVGPELAAAAEPDLAALVRDRVEAEYRARGDDLAPWLSLIAIEKHVQAMVGDAGFAALLEAAKGRADPRLCDLVDGVKFALYDTLTCFGDGPRWHVGLVDVLFDPCRSEIKRRAL